MEKVTSTTTKIEDVLNSLENLLKEKNKRYGNSALDGIKVFNKSDSASSIAIRLDDKLMRIKNSGNELRKNDVADLLGYLTLLCVANNWTDFTDLID